MASISEPAGTDNHSEQLKHIAEMLESLDGERRSLVVRVVAEMVTLLQHRN